MKPSLFPWEAEASPALTPDPTGDCQDSRYSSVYKQEKENNKNFTFSLKEYPCMPFALYTWCQNPSVYPFEPQLPSQGTAGSDCYQHHLFCHCCHSKD